RRGEVCDQRVPHLPAILPEWACETGSATVLPEPGLDVARLIGDVRGGGGGRNGLGRGAGWRRGVSAAAAQGHGCHESGGGGYDEHSDRRQPSAGPPRP